MNILDIVEGKEVVDNTVREECERFDPQLWTWGYEIEWGDIHRNLEIPKHLGSWDYCETDIVNLNGEYRGTASDPKGLSPPVGGEINVRPTNSIQEQVDRIMEIHDFFVENGDQPTSGIINHGHAHVHVPGLKDNPAGLRNLMRYIKRNQHSTMKHCYQFQEIAGMAEKTYLKHDGGRIHPEWLLDNLIEHTTSFDEFLRIHCRGKDAFGKVSIRPFRYGVHTYAMKNSNTIEFRCFRSSVDRFEIESCFKFMEKFIDAALNGGPDVEQIIAENNFRFPPFDYDHEMAVSWRETYKGKDSNILSKAEQEKMGLNKYGKARQFWEAS